MTGKAASGGVFPQTNESWGGRRIRLFLQDFVIGLYFFSARMEDQFSSSDRPSDEGCVTAGTGE